MSGLLEKVKSWLFAEEEDGYEAPSAEEESGAPAPAA